MFGDKEFDGVGYPTPSSIPSTMSWRTAKIPADAAWQGIFMGLVETLLDEKNWQQFEGGITREEAACIWLEIVESLYVSAEEGPCCPEFETDPATGLPQVSYDGGLTWEKFPQGAYDPDQTAPYAPKPRPLNQGSEAADICQAANNAALVLAQFWKETIGEFASGLGNALLAINRFLFDVNQTLYNLVYPDEAQLQKMLGFSEFPWPDYYDTPELSDDQVNAIICLLTDNATYADGVVSFSFTAVRDGMVDAVGLNPGVALQLLLDYIQQPGLDASGNTTATTTPNCDACGWEHTFDFRIDEQGWTLSIGTIDPGVGWVAGNAGDYRAVQGTITFPSTEITHAEWTISYAQGGGVADCSLNNIDGTAPMCYTTSNFSGVLSWTGSYTLEDMFINAVCSTDGSHTGSATSVQLTVGGPGTDPFV